QRRNAAFSALPSPGTSIWRARSAAGRILRGVKPLASKNPRIENPVAGGNARRDVLCHFRLRLGEVLRGAHGLFIVHPLAGGGKEERRAGRTLLWIAHQKLLRRKVVPPPPGPAHTTILPPPRRTLGRVWR